MDCTITYKGKVYTEQEFKRLVDKSFQQYVANNKNVVTQDLFNQAIKLADAYLSWTNFYSDEIVSEGNESYEPKEFDNTNIQKVFTIPGLNNVHFNHLVTHVFNKASLKLNVNYNQKISLEELKTEMNKSINESLDAFSKNLDNLSEQLSLLPQDNAQVKEYQTKLSVARNKIALVQDNLATIGEYGLSKLFKYAGIKVTENKEDNTVTIEEAPVNEGDNEENLDDVESSNDFDEVNSERDENYSQTSLEKNPKNSVRKELRLLMAGVEQVNKNGDKVLGAMGVPAYVDFDTIFDSCLEILADKNLNFDIAIQLLSESKGKPWMPQLIEKLKSADNQVKNQFLTVMGNHALKMEYVQYSFNKKTNTFHLKVMNTNSSELRRKVLNSWKTNLLGSDLIDNFEGEYYVNQLKAEQLYNQYKSWTNPIGTRLKGVKLNSDLQQKLAEQKSYALQSGKDVSAKEYEKIKNSVTESGKKIIELEDVEVNGRIRNVIKQVEVVNGKVIISDLQQSPIALVVNANNSTEYYSSLDVETKIKIIEELQNWLFNFGIQMEEDAINDILLGNYFVGKNERLSFNDFIKQPKTESNAPIGLLAKWLDNARTQKDMKITGEDEKNNPLRDNSVENGLAKLQAKYTDMFSVTSFRSGKKSIYGYTAYKYITDRVAALIQNDEGILDQLKSLEFSRNSAWLNFLQDDYLKSIFGISHLDLDAIKEAGKKIYKDNGITNLSDADHELVKLAMFMDMKQGSISDINDFKLPDGTTFKLRTARMLFPTMSDKSTMVVVKAPVFKLNNLNYYNFDTETNSYVINNNLSRLIFNQTVLPEIQRIMDFKSKGSSTNIKGYDAGAKMLMLMPGLNDLEIKLTGNGAVYEGTLKEFLNSQLSTIDNVINNDELLLQIYPEINKYVQTLANEKIKSWENAGYVINEEIDGNKTPTEFKYFDNEYLKSFESDNKTEVLNAMANDFVINSMITNANAFMTMIGDPALYYKSSPKKSAIEQSKESFINVGKRLAAMIAPGSKIANSKDEQYYQIFLKDRVSISENMEFLTEVLDNKKFDFEEYNRIISLPTETKEQQDFQAAEIIEFIKDYPNTNGGKTDGFGGFFDIESTDAQEYTTWKEHLHILKQTGKISDRAMSLTDEELNEAESMFTQNVPLDEMTDAQREILTKVLQPIKPVYTGQIFDEEQGVMRMMYIKSSSFPLIPQMTIGKELDNLRITLEDFEFKNGKNVRASFQTANKVGALNTPLKIFNSDGSINKFKPEQLQSAALILNRKDFKIQQEVPFKSLNRKEDTNTMGSQLTKVLFGNGMMELDNFIVDGKPFTGVELQQEFTNAHIELYNLKKKKLHDKIGINEKTGEPYDIKETAEKLQKLLRDEAIDRGWSKQEIDSLEIEYTYDENNNIDGYEFKLPLWLSSNVMRIESLLNAIVNNGVVKMKLPGNSYVAGSEEGFKIQKDYKGVDKSKIVWLNNFKGELEAAKYDENKNLKSAQILVPSKFRDNKGNIINLLEKNEDDTYKYVIEDKVRGFILNEKMFDPEILNLLTFRIPTSGHVSGAHVTIAGFLPFENGDLIITPKNFTKQMGQDFDIDKLNSYQLWHYQEESGKIRQLKEGDETSNIKEKLLQNKIVKIHNAVFNNASKEAQKKINNILSIQYAQDQAEEIDNLINANKDDKYFTPLSDEYQKQKMFLGASGKVGTGAYSLDVTSHSLFEQAKSKGNQLQLMIPETKDTSATPFKVRFGKGKNKSNGLLGESKTLDGDRTIAEVLAERQNIAVDNEKEQVMGRVNLNKYTLDVDKILVMLGFDKGENGDSIPFLFLSQPIIKEYVEEMAKASSNTKQFDPKAEEKVVQKLYDKYGSPNNLEYFDDQMSDKGLKEQLTKPTNGMQSAVFNKFMTLKSYGLNVRTIQTTINTDSKGLGKSITEIQEKLISVSKLKSETIVNAEKLIGDYVNAGDVSLKEAEKLIKAGYKLVNGVYILPTTISGVVTMNALITANNLWSKHFPYNSIVVNQITNEIMTLLSTGETSERKKAERRQLILKEMKKFLNAKMAYKTLFNNNSAQDERQRLFYDDKKTKKESLATYLKNLMNNSNFPQIKANKLLQRFEFDIDYSGKPSLIIYNNTGGGNFDEDALNNSLIELLGSDITLPEFDGKIYSAKLLAQDLINYTLLEGGIQESVQFAKFIPLAYLEKMGFNRAIQNFDLNSVQTLASFGYKENGPSDFAIQFAQNNPNILPKITLDEEVNAKELSQFTINPGEEKYGLKNTGELPAFVSFRDSGEDFLWQRVGDSFVQIPVTVTKGNSGHKVFSYNTKQGAIIPIKIKSQTKQKQQAQETNAVTKLTNSEKYGLGTESLPNVLRNILNNKSLPKNILSVLENLIDKIDPNTTIVVAPIQGNGKYNPDTNTITIDTERVKNATDEQLARTILKETVHSITDNLLMKHTNEEGTLEPKANTEGAQAVRNLITLYERVQQEFNKDKHQQKYKTVIQKFNDLRKGKPVRFNPEEKQIYYGAVNIKEFVEMIMTEPAFQQAMNEIKIGSSNTTLMDKLVKFIKSVLEAIGIEEGTLTDDAIKNIFQLIEDSKPTQTQFVASTQTESNLFSKDEIDAIKGNYLNADDLSIEQLKAVGSPLSLKLAKLKEDVKSASPFNKADMKLKAMDFLINNEEKLIKELQIFIQQPTQTQPTTERKTYSGKVTSLKPNQIFVFGSNPLGINGNPSKGTGGAALVAYNIAGVKQGEKMDNKLSDSGKAWGMTTVTSPGKKRSKTPQEITEGIKKLYEYAKQNPTKEFLVSDYSGTNLNGYTGQEMADMFNAAGTIPSNIVFNENFDKLIQTQLEVKEELKSQQPTTTTQAQTISDKEWDDYYGTVNGVMEDGSKLADKFYNPLFAAVEALKVKILTVSPLMKLNQGKDSLIKYGFTESQISNLEKLEGLTLVQKLDTLNKALGKAVTKDITQMTSANAIINEFKNREVSFFNKITGLNYGTQSTTTQPSTEVKIESGRYVKHQGETYIVTKINDNGTVQIYNPNKEGTDAKKSVAERNLEVTTNKGNIVPYRGAEYIVTPKGTIISLTSNKIMKWGEENGDRKAILALAQQEVKPTFTTQIDLNQEVYSKVKNTLVSLIKQENIQFELNPDSVEMPDDIDYSLFSGYPKIIELLENHLPTLKQYKFIQTNKELFNRILEETNANSFIEILDKLSIEAEEINASKVELSMSEESLGDVEKVVKESDEMIKNTLFDLGDGLEANKDQSAALLKLDDFIKSAGKQVFVLKGRGGTGKTTIIKKIIDRTENKQITFATISHKARIVLENSLGTVNPETTANTIASALGLRKDVTDESGDFVRVDNWTDMDSPFYHSDIIVIDECSVINEEVFEEILRLAKKPNAKIIFMGDNVQLPPIRKEGDKNKDKDSPTFDSNSNNEYTATLKERMRQGKESPIVSISDIIATNVESKSPDRRVLDNHRKSKYDAKSGKGILFETRQTMTQYLEKDLKNKDTRYNTKLISYTNTEANNLNNLARQIIWGNTNIDYHIGELLTMNAAYGESKKNKETGEEEGNIVYNGEDVIVIDSKPTSIYLSKVNIDGSITNVSLPGFMLKVQKTDGTQQEMPVLSQQSKAAFKQLQEQNVENIKKQPNYLKGSFWKNYFYPNIDAHGNISYGYAITSHKAQGSTYENTYIFEDDIVGVAKASNKQVNQSLYVAITRPKLKAVVVSNKNASASSKIIEDTDDIVRDSKAERVIKTFSKKSFEPKEDWTSENNECGI